MKYILIGFMLVILSSCNNKPEPAVHYETVINNHLIVCEKQYRTTSGAILGDCRDVSSGKHVRDIQMATNYIITPSDEIY